ncbi:TetR/AcrR family transcriptional regulator [Streptomyces sp. NBC_01304]|uniref:TetR/AcrR family transcriptional regulator n=1 Tax=Streptomyces sp. NBC_01304 TaxID=2903818 RepID=UPI002E10A775|nr:TetR/AcrR family transcriptional regulator [Streptomyces sp. NBC_01304]
MDQQEGVRRRDAAATREAILHSARKAFARSGYDGVGVREIAAGAGVTAMLVNRYFGSKEQLFIDVLDECMRQPRVMSDDNIKSPTAARDLATALVRQTERGAPPLDGFMIMLHSASSAQAAPYARKLVEEHHHRTLAQGLDGQLAPQRAALVLSLVSGFQVMRQMYGLSALADADSETLIDLLTPLLEQLIHPLGSPTAG